MNTKGICVFLLWVWLMAITTAFFGLVEDFLRLQAFKAKACEVRK